MDDEVIVGTRTRQEVQAYIDGIQHACRSLARNIERYPTDPKRALVLHSKGMDAAVWALTRVLEGAPIEEAIAQLMEDID